MNLNRLCVFWIWIISGCMGNEPVRLFSSAPEYILDSSAFISTKSTQSFAYSFSEITYLPKKWNYPPAPWLVIPNGVIIPQSINRKALLLGAILTDLAYLAHNNQLNQSGHLLNLLDTLNVSFPWTQWNARGLKNLYENPDKFLLNLNFLHADAEMMAVEFEQKRLNYYVQIGSLIESFYLCSNISTLKTDTLNMVYYLENQKNNIQEYIKYFEDSDTLVAKMLPGLKVVPDMLILTQTIQVWDSLTNESHQQTFTLEKPLLDLQKYTAQLRKEWILYE